MNEKQNVYGWAAMLGVVAAMGSYAISKDTIPGFGDRKC